MRRVCWLMTIALAMGACAPAVQERLREYSDDGLHLYQQGQYAAARDSFQAALQLKPDDVGLLYNLGQCYDRLGNASRAEHYYTECLQRSSNHAACRQALAALLVRQDRWPDAVRMVEDWLTQEPKLASAYAVDGWLWHQTSDLPRAQARLQQALQLDPHDRLALAELALVYEEMQRPDRALVLYERCLLQDPHQPDVARRLNLLLAKGAKRPRPD